MASLNQLASSSLKNRVKEREEKQQARVNRIIIQNIERQEREQYQRIRMNQVRAGDFIYLSGDEWEVVETMDYGSKLMLMCHESELMIPFDDHAGWTRTYYDMPYDYAEWMLIGTLNPDITVTQYLDEIRERNAMSHEEWAEMARELASIDWGWDDGWDS